MPVAVLCVCCRANETSGAGPPAARHLKETPVILRRRTFFFLGEVVTEVICWAGCLLVQPVVSCVVGTVGCSLSIHKYGVVRAFTPSSYRLECMSRFLGCALVFAPMTRYLDT